MHLEAEIERVWRCTWRPTSSELRDALGGRNRMSLEAIDRANLEAVIKRVWRCTWRPWAFELGGHDRASLDIHLEAESE